MNNKVYIWAILTLVVILTAGCTQTKVSRDLIVYVYNPDFGAPVNGAYVEVYRYSDQKTIASGYIASDYKIEFKNLLDPYDSYMVKATHRGRNGKLLVMTTTVSTMEVVVELD